MKETGGMKRAPGTSMRLPEPIERLWTATAKKKSLSKTAVFIIALQEYAERNGVTVPEEEGIEDK